MLIIIKLNRDSNNPKIVRLVFNKVGQGISIKYHQQLDWEITTMTITWEAVYISTMD